ncbi:hypothetical protein [Mesorhizobium sp.]|uniref:hypothetical protein n=1 Tax=Mesorhizobium sp. TaxID=1871066 RepID=UPI00257CC6BF|nr:hypothetical protein [Mesorhizobium sp.]
MGAAFDFDAIGVAFVEAALDPSRWDAAMEVAEKATGSAGALLFDMKGHLPLVPCSRTMAPALDTYVRDGWIDRDERYRLVNFLDRKGVTSEFDLLTSDDIAKHPYYQEFLAPFGLRWCGRQDRCRRRLLVTVAATVDPTGSVHAGRDGTAGAAFETAGLCGRSCAGNRFREGRRGTGCV